MAVGIEEPSLESHSWIVDSGSSYHICNDISIFQNVREEERSSLTNTGITQKTELLGDIILIIPSENGLFRLKLKDISYSPGAKFNMLSEGRLRKGGIWIDGKDQTLIWKGIVIGQCL